MGKTAFVLSGGGSRGAYQIGVCEGLAECGIEPEIVTGTSVGALNGAMIAQGDYKTARRLWREIDNSKVMDVTLDSVNPQDWREAADVFVCFARQFFRGHGADNTPLRELLASCIEEERVRSSKIRLGIVTVALPGFTVCQRFIEEIPEGKLLDYLLASAACFPAMRPQEIDGNRYIDGGYADYLPVEMAVSRGADRIYCVDLHAPGRVRPYCSDGISVVSISTDWDLGSFLVFDKAFAVRNLALGHQDALKALGKRDGLLYTFPLGEFAGYEADDISFLQHLHQKLFGGTAIFAAGTLAPPAVTDYLKSFYHHYEPARISLYAALVENAGKVLEIDPVPCRTMQEYHEELLCKLRQVRLAEREGWAHKYGIRLRQCACLYELMLAARSDAAARLKLMASCSFCACEYAAALYLHAVGAGLSEEAVI